MTEPRPAMAALTAQTPDHYLKHLVKYAGELAAALEKLDHSESAHEVTLGRLLLHDFLDRRMAQLLQTTALLRISIARSVGVSVVRGGPGLFQKYLVTKADGSPMDPGAGYLVLRMDKDPHAWAAALAYAGSIVHSNPTFAADLRAWVDRARHAQEVSA